MIAERLPPRKATYADIEALPDEVVGEILAGELVVSPRPRLRHASALGGIQTQTMGPFQHGRGGPGGWVILPEPELRLGVDPDFDTVVPDLAGWRRERWPEVPDEAAATLAPDWVCEVLSPKTAFADRVHKLPFYARAQIGWAWLVDADQHLLEVFEQHGGRWLLHSVHSGDAAAAIPPFEAVPIELGLLWKP
jgi:Uma2 family endonuclease